MLQQPPAVPTSAAQGPLGRARPSPRGSASPGEPAIKPSRAEGEATGAGGANQGSFKGQSRGKHLLWLWGLRLCFALAAAGEDGPAGGALRHTLAALPAAMGQVSRAGRQAARQTADPWAGISCSYPEPTRRRAGVCAQLSTGAGWRRAAPTQEPLMRQRRTGGSIF